MKWSKTFTLPNGFGYVEISRSGDIDVVNDIEPKSFFSWDTEEEFNKLLEELLIEKMRWDGGIKKPSIKSECVKTPLNSKSNLTKEEFEKQCIDHDGNGCTCNKLELKPTVHGRCKSTECRKNDAVANRISKMKSYRDLRKNDKSKPVKPCSECACSSRNMFGDLICRNPNSLRFEEIVGKYTGCKLFIPKPVTTDSTALILEKLEGIEKRLSNLEKSESPDAKRCYPSTDYSTDHVYCTVRKPAYAHNRIARNSQYRKKPYKYSTTKRYTTTKFVRQEPDTATEPEPAATNETTTTAVRRGKPVE